MLTSLLKPALFNTVLVLVQDAVIFAESAGGNGQDKKTIAVKMATDAYNVADKSFDFPDIVDRIVISLIPSLIDGAVLFFNKNGLFSKT
jgi:hypothetical protein